MPTTAAPSLLRPWLLTHVALLRDARGLRGALAAMDPTDHLATAELAACVAWTEAMLLEVHEREDDRFWPRLSRLAPDFRLHAVRLEADHQRIEHLMTQVRMGLAALEVAPDHATARSVHRQVTLHAAAFEAHLSDHVGREEATVLATIERSVADWELQALVREVKGRGGLAQQWHGLPWSLSAASPHERTMAVTALPPARRVVLRASEAGFRRRFSTILRHAQTSARADHPSMHLRARGDLAGRAG